MIIKIDVNAVNYSTFSINNANNDVDNNVIVPVARENENMQLQFLMV